MYRALEILELVEIVCGYLLEPDSPEATRFSNLNAFARTCKFFVGPSIDLLWKTQNTLGNLFKCMPSDIWKETTNAGYTEHYLLRPMLLSDWERPLMYASCVKHLILVEAPMLSTHHGPPNPEDLFPYIRLFLGPKIRGISLYLEDSKSALSALPALSHKCPALQFAAIRSTALYNDDELRSVSLFIRGLTQLVTLEVNVIDRAAFQHLGHLPALRSLKIGTLNGWNDPRHPAPLPRLPFPALRILHFEDTSVAKASAHIEMLSECQLSLLTVDLTAPATAAATTGFYAALAAHCVPATLNALDVSNAEWYTPRLPFGANPAAFCVPSAALRQLCCFNELMMVCLQSPAGFAFDDATAWALASAWPRLQLLVLTADASAPTDVMAAAPRATLDALRAFAQHCPELRGLTIPLTALAVPSSEGPGPVQTCMTSLDVGTAPIAAPAELVAEFMAGLFPALRDLKTDSEVDDEDDDDADDAWDEVRALLAGETSSGDDTDQSGDDGGDTDSDDTNDDDPDGDDTQ
ncbi:hypothetical protein DFH09DRAFT_1361176 [Mycena vulgaris]|nr:hypothetical protein DFH09DRAFT_1361176 [Mycena vulgaris]